MDPTSLISKMQTGKVKKKNKNENKAVFIEASRRIKTKKSVKEIMN